MKRTTHCKMGHERTPDNVAKNRGCKICKNNYYEKHKEAYIASATKYQQEHGFERRDRVNKRCAELKVEVLTHYSPNQKLNCSWEGCTTTDIDMLSLDHINNDGAQHRKLMSNAGGKNTYQWVKKHNYPEGFQTLCMNHQTKKKISKSHKDRKNLIREETQDGK